MKIFDDVVQDLVESPLIHLFQETKPIFSNTAQEHTPKMPTRTAIEHKCSRSPADYTHEDRRGEKTKLLGDMFIHDRTRGRVLNLYLPNRHGLHEFVRLHRAFLEWRTQLLEALLQVLFRFELHRAEQHRPDHLGDGAHRGGLGVVPAHHH